LIRESKDSLGKSLRNARDFKMNPENYLLTTAVRSTGVRERAAATADAKLLSSTGFEKFKLAPV
jgi:hypothetical protein